jgi:hypothetical protein
VSIDSVTAVIWGGGAIEAVHRAFITPTAVVHPARKCRAYDHATAVYSIR